MCAHFIVDTDGTVYQLVRLSLMCRHTTGLNQHAIGVEHVGMSHADVLRNGPQLRASLALTAWLVARYRIPLANVIGHNESLEHPLRYERYAAWRCQTHADFPRAAMDVPATEPLLRTPASLSRRHAGATHRAAAVSGLVLLETAAEQPVEHQIGSALPCRALQLVLPARLCRCRSASQR